MNIKKKIPRLMSILLSFSMAFGGVIPAYATEAIITENSIEEAEFDATAVNEIDEEAVADEIEAQADSDSRYETVEVNYSQSSNYFVTIPKTIVLGTDKMSPYSIKVEGDIVANKQVCVVPVDGIEETEVFDFYMSDQIAGSTKADVVAEVSQTKFYWSHEEVAAGYEENDNYIVADGLSAGKWKGIFQLEISMRTDPAHIHNYVGEVTKEPTCTESGEKTYTCDCGDSYVETIDPTGHHFEKGECTICGEKDPDHEHNYTEVVTKQPTCTEDGEKTYTCDCGDSYTEIIPATGHHYVDGECEHCGEKDPDAHTHNYIETITKEPTCTENGEKKYTCECGDSYTEVIPATGHHYVDGECEYCGEKDPDAHTHNYIETITKEPTCTEDGEKKYTCECGDSYTEVIPAGHHYGDDDKCTECGEFNPNHTHNYVDNTKIFLLENTSNGTYAFVQDGTKWTSNNKGIKSSTATSTWTISVTEDTEYSFKYKVSSEQGYDKLTIKLDNTTVANAISGIGNEETYTTTLTAGTHTLTASYVKDGSGDRDSDCGYVILEDIGEFNHKCTICQNLEDHNYIEEITKEPCIENGEKTYTCNVCGYTYTEEIPSYGKHIDEDGDNICDVCGHNHIWEENVDVANWSVINGSAYSVSNNKYTFSSSYGWNPVVSWEVSVPDTAEFQITYYNWTSGKLIVKLDDEEILDKTTYVSRTDTITLTPGTHTLYATWEKVSTSSSSWPTMTLTKVNYSNHICNECKETLIHEYTESITKIPTCTKVGEKEFSCVKCGYSYTEEIPMDGGQHIDENGDDICDKCGHKHIWEENTDVISWIDNSMSSSVVQTGNSWKLRYNTSNQYSTYTVNGYWNITVPQNVEYTFNYSSGFMSTNDRVRIYVDDELIVDFANSDKYGSEKILLAEGEHTIHMCFNKNNTIGTSAYATITLNPVEALNHICNDCGEKKVHIYTERITKEPTCTEKGEKELTCTKCVHSHTEEIEATGHDYVDNTVGNYSNHKCTVCGDEKEHTYGDDLVCTVCGHIRGDYTLIFNSESKIGNLSSDTEYELEKVYLSDGDQIILPNASSSDYSLDGWYYAKAVNQPYMYNKGLSHALNGTYDKSYDCWANVDVKLQSRGDGVHVTDHNTGKEWYTNYEWQNEATTDIFTISTPSVYEFQITEKQDINTITLDGGWSLQYLLKDITNNKSYDLRDIVPFLDNTVIKYDYGNIKIKCSKVDNAHMNSSKIINGTITYYYTVYFEPGEYQITLSGSIGSSTASPTTSTIDVNMYGSGADSHFYELHSLNDGETFDASAMYTEEGNKEIYCIPKWKNIE